MLVLTASLRVVIACTRYNALLLFLEVVCVSGRLLGGTSQLYRILKLLRKRSKGLEVGGRWVF